jgi:hypothetical protein
MSKTYVFTGMFCVGAESEEQARDGLMELVAEIVARDNDEAFVLEEILTEEGNDQ